MNDLENWQPRPRPARVTLEGRYCRLEPLDPLMHGDDLFAASMGPGEEERFRYLFDSPQDRPSYEQWLARSAALDDPLMFAVIDRATGRAEGRQTLMRITPEHGVIEIGNILWGSRIARTRVATEALFIVDFTTRRTTRADEPLARAPSETRTLYAGSLRLWGALPLAGSAAVYAAFGAEFLLNRFDHVVRGTDSTEPSITQLAARPRADVGLSYAFF